MEEIWKYGNTCTHTVRIQAGVHGSLHERLHAWCMITYIWDGIITYLALTPARDCSPPSGAFLYTKKGTGTDTDFQSRALFLYTLDISGKNWYDEREKPRALNSQNNYQMLKAQINSKRSTIFTLASPHRLSSSTASAIIPGRSTTQQQNQQN